MNSTSMEPMSAFTGTQVFGEIGVEETAVAWIDLAGFAQRRSDAPHHAASDLAGRSSRAHHPPAIGDADDARYSHASCGRLDPHLHEMRDVAEGHEIRVDGTRKRQLTRSQPAIDRILLPGTFLADFDLQRSAPGGLQDLRRSSTGRAARGQFGQSLEHCIRGLDGGRNGRGRAPGTGGHVLGSGARVADHRHDIRRWNAKLAADSGGERSANPLPHLVPADDDEYAAVDR